MLHLGCLHEHLDYCAIALALYLHAEHVCYFELCTLERLHSVTVGS